MDVSCLKDASGHDAETQKLLEEEALLNQRQQEVKKRLNLLNGGQVSKPTPSPPRKGPPSVATSLRSDACTASESDDDDQDGDLGLGLGIVHDPKTGKATWLHYVCFHVALFVRAWRKFMLLRF